eukprot:CAMPEP_0114252006 /NCGR_PEP_ID=MMETSP0058-20121206/15591_1 /TAXON_ID=36894 /ORGANISM="Pyramimonas parkeae, CCMP726" /LENGTH=304 /DNA_ID=CAMNT_0001365881 /DNA_START=62 /DNA_END=976 /DNA_ORIENTATION=+
MATISFTSSPMRLNTSSCKGNTASSARARPARGTRKFVRNIVIASTNPASASGFEDTEGRALDRQISGGKSGVNHAARMAFFGSVELESAIARQTSGGLRPDIARAKKAQAWIENWRAKSAETQRLAKEASDSVRPEIARALEAQTWIEAWRAKSRRNPAATNPGLGDLQRSALERQMSGGVANGNAATRASDIGDVQDSALERQTAGGLRPDIARAQEAQAWIQNWRNKPAPSTESPEVDESVLFEISERVNERAAWIAKWRRAAEGVDREQPDKDVWGCTDNNADNFAPHSKYDDGSCVYKF